MRTIDRTHDLGLRSWLESANDEASDFPVQNLPFGAYESSSDEGGVSSRLAVAIGDRLLDSAEPRSCWSVQRSRRRDLSGGSRPAAQ